MSSALTSAASQTARSVDLVFKETPCIMVNASPRYKDAAHRMNAKANANTRSGGDAHGRPSAHRCVIIISSALVQAHALAHALASLRAPVRLTHTYARASLRYDAMRARARWYCVASCCVEPSRGVVVSSRLVESTRWAMSARKTSTARTKIKNISPA